MLRSHAFPRELPSLLLQPVGFNTLNMKREKMRPKTVGKMRVFSKHTLTHTHDALVSINDRRGKSSCCWRRRRKRRRNF